MPVLMEAALPSAAYRPAVPYSSPEGDGSARPSLPPHTARQGQSLTQPTPTLPNGRVPIRARAEDGDDSMRRRRRRESERGRLAPGAGSVGRRQCWMSQSYSQKSSSALMTSVGRQRGPGFIGSGGGEPLTWDEPKEPGFKGGISLQPARHRDGPFRKGRLRPPARGSQEIPRGKGVSARHVPTALG